jgi:hypothetical protein
MNRKIAFTALSLAIVLGGASAAFSAGKKHGGHEAYGSVGGTVADPRQNKGSNHETWCDLDAQCNGWAEWSKDVSEGKLSAGK